ncbi:ABC transporter permease [Streptomyces sp. NPDC005373]|uniref:ABC transporter permease n=1 Tax=Streptomyces sp. NPDC005373 TaxID=3156879 RepID=UPI0033B72337
MAADLETESPASPAPGARRRSRRRGVLERRITGWTLIVLLLVTWQWYASAHTIAELPPLSTIAEEGWSQMFGGDLPTALADTVGTTLIGFALATVIGTVLGFLMGRVKPVWALLEPVIELVRQTPVTALFPLLILYLGIGTGLKITMVALVATFPILLNAYAGARNVSRTMHLTGRTFKLSWLQTQWEIALPSALPHILVGMRQALGVSLVVSVVSGMLAGNSGIGYYILSAQQILDVPSLFAGVLSIAVVGYTLNQIFLFLDARLTRWRRHAEHS